MNTLSIIIPWFKKLSLFRVAVRQNRLFLDKRVQVVIVMDDPSEEVEAVEFITSVPHVNWKVIVNDAPHGWRPPCSAINVGIRNSTGTHIAVVCPEIMVNLPTNEYLFRVLKKLKTKRYYLTGHLHNIEFNQSEIESPCFGDMIEYRRAVLIEQPIKGFGFILVPRETIEAIHGYDEGRRCYGGDDDDIRIRLRKNKCKHICDPNIRLVHMWHNDTKRQGYIAPVGKVVVLTKQPNWGMEFNRVSYETKKEETNIETARPDGGGVEEIQNNSQVESEKASEQSASGESGENHTNLYAGSVRNEAETVAQDAGQSLGESGEGQIT